MKLTTVVVAAVVSATIGLFATTAPAAAEDRLALVTVNAPVYLLPDARRIPLRMLEVREYLRVRKNEGEWLRVDFQDLQFGLRTGYIEARFVQLIPIEREEQAELVSVDLGLKAPVATDTSSSGGARRGSSATSSAPTSTRNRHRE
jgi:hypothetical protein